MTAVRTPSGRIYTELGNPPGRPKGPTQDLVPVGPPPTDDGAVMGEVRQIRAVASPSPSPMTIGFPNLSSAGVSVEGNFANAIPWTQFYANIWRLVQPTGIIPGTYAGIVFNVYGQAISASTSGASFDNPTLNSPTLNNPTLTGEATAPTPPANDNSQAIATTAWVREQGYATESFVTSQGFATETFVTNALIGYATEAWVLSQGFITDSPHDGNVYGRQNGQWVVVSPGGT